MHEPFKTFYFEDLSVGMRESLMKTVMNEDVVGFAELSGDHNPIHLWITSRKNRALASALRMASIPPA